MIRLMKLLALMCLPWLMAAQANASVIHIISDPAIEGESRRVMEESTRTLTTTGKGLAALEQLISSFPPEVLDSMGTSSFYNYTDPPRAAALQALHAWYSIDFIEEAMQSGTDDAAYWALRKLAHQAINSPNKDEDTDSTRRLVAVKGVVTYDVRTRLIPVLEKLRTAKSERTRTEALKFAQGLLLDRAAFLQSLQEKDEKALNATLMQMLDRVHIDPHLTQEIWTVLTRARTDSLRGTCLRYPWLLDPPEWTAAKSALLTQYLRQPGSAAYNNSISALWALARSDNPLAEKILASLPTIDDQHLKEQLARMQSQRRKRHAR